MAELTSVIPVYNGLPYIEELLASLEAQTRRPDRVVVLDNCSTDRTVECVKQFATRLPIQLVRRPENIGSLRNFNEALDLASSTDFLHLTSHDDILEPSFFERMLPLVDQTPGRALAHSQFTPIDAAGRLADPHFVAGTGPAQELSLRQFLGRQAELQHVYIQTALFKTNRQPPPVHFQDGWQQAADVLFFAEHASHCTRLVTLPQALVRFRIHAGSATGRSVKNVGVFVGEEWRVMTEIARMIREGAAAHWLRLQKLRCIFAARTQVKIQRFSREAPEVVGDVATLGRQLAGPVAWALGGLAVMVRDRLRSLRQPRS